MFGYGALAASAGVGSAIQVIKTIASAAGAPNAAPLADLLPSLGIDVGALAAFAYLFTIERGAQQKQLARLKREESLAELKVELGNGKLVNLGMLRDFARVVVIAGDEAYVEEALAAAEPLKGDLQELGNGKLVNLGMLRDFA